MLTGRRSRLQADTRCSTMPVARRCRCSARVALLAASAVVCCSFPALPFVPGRQAGQHHLERVGAHGELRHPSSAGLLGDVRTSASVGAQSGVALLIASSAAVSGAALALGLRKQPSATMGGAKCGLLRQRLARTICRGLNTGIVGLPNVGKSTLFNALCDFGKAEAANFPFCTIDPNTGKSAVPDTRLQKLAEMAKSEKVIPESIEYVDIAGLVKGASKGEGLGNKFLGNIRSVDAIVHVVRCFEDEGITHVDGSVDPARDIETINLELIFSDLDQCEKRLQKLEKDVRNKVEGAAKEQEVIKEKVVPTLEANRPIRVAGLDEDDEKVVKHLGFITQKPVIFAANVIEDELATGNAFADEVKRIAAENGDKAVIVSASVEAELNTLEPEDRVDYLESLGVKESGCETLVKETYSLLGLRTYFTCGPQETRAWTIREGWTAPQAAGVIHTDFEKGFIKAETIQWDELLECGSEEGAKAKGKLRIEGKEYEVADGDVMHFRFKA